jgi:hypothetical protein
MLLSNKISSLKWIIYTRVVNKVIFTNGLSVQWRKRLTHVYFWDIWVRVNKLSRRTQSSEKVIIVYCVFWPCAWSQICKISNHLELFGSSNTTQSSVCFRFTHTKIKKTQKKTSIRSVCKPTKKCNCKIPITMCNSEIFFVGSTWNFTWVNCQINNSRTTRRNECGGKLPPTIRMLKVKLEIRPSKLLLL